MVDTERMAGRRSWSWWWATAWAAALVAASVPCAGCASAMESAVDNAAMGPPRSVAEAQQREQLRDQEDQASAAAAPGPYACVRGSVTSTGPLGHPLANVDVVAAYDGGARERTRTDFSGRFHLCPRRDDSGAVGSAIFGTDRYSGPDIGAAVTFSRDGFTAKTVRVRFEGDRVDPPLDVVLTQ